ncbi:MAG: cell division/cell wall cluster transcriptional repressor MraZ [Prevotella sp.]|nr:cell division/cell wall cluster transcriptional repressor MraZ [Prevotella sp.]MBR6716631.1 cell division/cell wall cluster transcriptional repressor MraZ [Prevotella sp.]
MRLFGNIEAKIDTKGRAFLPSVFRKVLQAQGEEVLYLRKDAFQPCLVLYPESVWHQEVDSLRKRLNRWNARQQMIYRQYVDDVEMITLDASGRLLLSKRQLEKANIEQSIKFIGMGETIEIWRNDENDEPFMDPEEFSKALEELMGNTFDDPAINFPERE